MKFVTLVLVVSTWIICSMIHQELKEIKHMVNDVVCVALEMEETYHE